ncbi:S1 family peptidase [Methylobacillus caricis]|uniref:trypsin-like serine protease n=1 Tax=Methylobacillus caricis TaxID=1971611 RepID=UPI001CFFC9B2|nr:trypsin-like serine protease [Methylobacillus caricis]MCB5186922.1 S1 family peptidase [Methylobacillus caricis]
MPAVPAQLHVSILLAILVCSTPAHALLNGTPSTDFDMVGQIVGGADGVLIAPNWVLTAGHAATTGKMFSSGAGSAMIDAKFILPNYNFPGNDLALLHLSSAIENQPFTALNLTYIEAGNIADFSTVTLANASGNGNNQYVETTLVNAYAHAGNYFVHWIVADQSPDGRPIVQGGDSGSALYLGLADTVAPVLGGIASAICLTNKSCYVQPTAYRDWLDITMMLYVPSNPDETPRQSVQWVETVSIPGGISSMASSSVAAVPEPSTILLMLSGLLLGWRKFRQQYQDALPRRINPGF